MPTTIQMPTSVFICLIAFMLYVLLRDDVIPAIKSFTSKKFARRINGVTIDFKIERKKVAELN